MVATQNPDQPLLVFTGDTLFIGSVGRPDLLGEGMAASTLASMMFDTWNDKLAKLPDDDRLPGPRCGFALRAHLSDAPTSTIGEQRVSNPYLAYKSRGEFVAAVLEGLPEAPQYFQHNADQPRRSGTRRLATEHAAAMTPDAALTDPAQYYVVDIRGAEDYSAAHIPNSVNIDLRGRFETWVGIMVPWDAKLVLCGEEKDLRKLSSACTAWATTARTTRSRASCRRMAACRAAHQTSQMIPPQKLTSRCSRRSRRWWWTCVCRPSGWECASARWSTCRSASWLRRRASSTEPAGGGRVQQRLSVEHGGGHSGTGGLPAARQPGRRQRGLDRRRPARDRSHEEWRRCEARDQIGGTDFRRRTEADAHGPARYVPAGRHSARIAVRRLPFASGAERGHRGLLANPAYLTGAGPLVIVDRDGSLAMMVGGILSQKTQRPIKVLYGGLAAYWSETELSGAAVPVTAATAGVSQPAPRAVPAYRRGLPTGGTGQTEEEERGVLKWKYSIDLKTDRDRGPAPYWNPYIAGLLLGATLLASFLILGAGLGASAGPARLGAFLEQCLVPAHVAESDYFGHWVEEGKSLLSYYLVFMFAGVFLGGMFSAILARRVRSAWNAARHAVSDCGLVWHWAAACWWALPAGWPTAAPRARRSAAARCCSTAAWYSWSVSLPAVMPRLGS